MVKVSDILCFASSRKVFTRKELLDNIQIRNPEDSSGSFSEQLHRLLKSGQIIRLERGVYAFSEKKKKDFLPTCSDDIRSIDMQIKKQFPFADYCIWDTSAILPYMFHMPIVKFICVDIERAAIESVFNFLNTGNAKRIYLMPTRIEFERYVSGNEAIIIRPLITESPLQIFEGISTPAIEKVLVDIVSDVEFSFLQGSELHFVYTTIFEQHNINKNKLLRYAARRGRKQLVEKLLKDNKL